MCVIKDCEGGVNGERYGGFVKRRLVVPTVQIAKFDDLTDLAKQFAEGKICPLLLMRPCVNLLSR